MSCAPGQPVERNLLALPGDAGHSPASPVPPWGGQAQLQQCWGAEQPPEPLPHKRPGWALWLIHRCHPQQEALLGLALGVGC